jgi:hypothetical protein
MSKIIGVTVGTPTSPKAMADKLKPVTSVNGVKPDDNGNVKLPSYNGGYEVIPNTNADIVLSTAQTYMDADIKVTKIPFAEVSNNSGGTTATIG